MSRSSWDEAVAFALTLPDTELSTSYGKPAVKCERPRLPLPRPRGQDFVRARDRPRHESRC